MMDSKQKLRRSVRESIAMMTAEDRFAASVDACRQVVGTAEWQSADCVLLYSSLPDEVQTDMLIDTAVAQGKRILLPVISADCTLRLFVYDKAHLRTEPLYGITEPSPDAEEDTDYRNVRLAVVPGRAFCTDGRRLGRGKGYYDRLLCRLTCPMFGVAFPCQIVADVPVTATDVALDRVFFKDK